jgi:hypothetical protein
MRRKRQKPKRNIEEKSEADFDGRYHLKTQPKDEMKHGKRRLTAIGVIKI